jgi:hypothetical protein
MNTDLIGAVELTASAAIMIAALSSAFGNGAARRIRIAAWLSAWFVLVVILAATRALHYEHGGTVGLGLAVVLPIVILCLVVARAESLRQALPRVSLPLFISLHTVRVLGVSFLILYAAGRLPAPFAPVAGWGDILVGATAPLVAWFVYRRFTNARPVLWIWNVIGTLDLITAVFLGATSSPGPVRLFFGEPTTAIMTTLPWLLIPGFLVPLLFAVHIGIFVRLAARASRRSGFLAPTFFDTKPLSGTIPGHEKT